VGDSSNLFSVAQQKDAADPKQAARHFHLGCKLAKAGEHQKAIEELRQAARLAPTQANYRYQLGLSLQALRQFPAAAAVYRGCVEISPKMADAWSNLGVALSESCDCNGAIACFLRVQQLKPASAEGFFNAGVCYASLWEHGKAVEQLSKAISLRPSMSAAYIWRGKSLHVLGDMREAINSYRKALSYDPASAEAHWGLSLAHLMLGEYAEGWKEYEWRWRWAQFPSARRNFSQPQWSGEPLEGRSILLHAEQGFGDTLQFVRYAPLVAAAGGRVILEVQPELFALLRDYPGVAQCVQSGEALPRFDLHCPLMSLPLAFATTAESIPAAVPIRLQVAESLQASEADGLRVGLVWAGNKIHQWNGQRSLGLTQFAPLWRLAGAVRFVSLQKGQAAAQRIESQLPFAMEDGVATAKDFADTAAVIAGLDLVITVDTAVAHLAGSMGKPVWILIPESPDWRWGLTGESTPWYPTARLFRATRSGGWPELMAQVAAELEKRCNQRSEVATREF